MAVTWKKIAYAVDVLPGALSPYAVGDLIYAPTTTTLGKLADVAVGSYLKSGGVGAIPAWATLNQAAVAGLTTADGPSFAHLHLVDLAAIYTATESWIGPSSTYGIYFKGGNVGIGTTGPQANLHVVSRDTSQPTLFLQGQMPTIKQTVQRPTGGAAFSLFDIYGQTIGGAETAWGQVGILGSMISEPATILYMYFGAGATTWSSNTFRLYPGQIANFQGNVGIGTVAPTNLLSLGSEVARTIWMERRISLNNAGLALTVQAGGSTNGMVSTVTVVAGGTGYSPADVLTLLLPSGGLSATITVATIAATGGLKTLSIVAGGTGYTPGTVVLTVVQGGASLGTISCTADAGGIITSINSVVTIGSGYSVGTPLATTGGGNNDCTVNLSVINGAVATVTVTTKGAKYTTGTKTTTVAPAGGTGCTIGVATIESATDKDGGALILKPGTSSGSGTGQVQIWTSPPGASSAVDNALLQRLTVDGLGNLLLNIAALGTSAAKVLGMASGTAPSSFLADMAQMCVKDQAAGNACFHFYTELGQIIKLYQQAALTAALTGITYTAPGTPDYALQDLVQNTGFGFATKDEGNSVLAVVASLQTRVGEIATILANCGLTA